MVISKRYDDNDNSEHEMRVELKDESYSMQKLDCPILLPWSMFLQLITLN